MDLAPSESIDLYWEREVARRHGYGESTPSVRWVAEPDPYAAREPPANLGFSRQSSDWSEAPDRWDAAEQRAWQALKPSC